MAQPFQRGPMGGVGAGAGIAGRVCHCLEPQRQIDGGAARQRVALGQKRGQGRGLPACGFQHMAQTRVQRQGGQAAAMGGDMARAIQRAQQFQQLLGLGKSAGVGWADKGQITGCCAP